MSVLKSRKARALLAGGVVLGVGASMTLAAWTDSEWAKGTFGTGGFTFQGSTTETGAYADHKTAGTAAEMTFVLDANDLEPGDSVTGSYWVKTDGTPATVTIQPAVATDNALADALQVEIYKGACSGTPLADATGSLETTGASLGTVADTPVQTCFKVTLPQDFTSAQALETTAAWEFKAATA